MNADPLIVFLGPSLSLVEARKILPNAYYLPPARSGDILRALRLNPKVIALIDGYFEQRPAVWHKEILVALEKGIAVIGGSSMGALRASELWQFGMQPVGDIAHDYAHGIINDDDEVAVLHCPGRLGYVPATDAMVNIRWKLQSAVLKGIISHEFSVLVEQAAKNMFYKERQLDKAVMQVCAENNIESAKTILENIKLFDNALSEKKQNDAALVLEQIAAGLIKRQSNVKHTTERTAFFRALHKNIMCRPYPNYQSWLPSNEKVASIARYLGQDYRLARRLAYLLSACYAVAKYDQAKMMYQEKEAISGRWISKLGLGLMDNDWTLLNDCNEKENFFSRMAAIFSAFESENANLEVDVKSPKYLHYLLCLSGDYVKYKKHNNTNDVVAQFKQSEPARYRLFNCVAHCWWFIEVRAEHLGLRPNEGELQGQSDRFRIEKGLHTKDATEQWINENDLDLIKYQHFIMATARLSFLVLQNNLDALGVIDDVSDESVWWLRDALWLSGLYQQAKCLINDPKRVVQLQNEAVHREKNLQQYAFSIDFIDGQQDFMQTFLLEQDYQPSSVLSQ